MNRKVYFETYRENKVYSTSFLGSTKVSLKGWTLSNCAFTQALLSSLCRTPTIAEKLVEVST